MATFRVGQRVRLVRPTHPHNYGIEGVIIALVTVAPGDICLDPSDRKRKISRCQFDCIVRYSDEDCYDHTSRLEPIQPEGNQVISWSECLWQPEKGVVA